MKTNNYQLDLMIPNQASKDVIYNESILVIDNYLNSSVIGFIDQKPDKLHYKEKYVIASGQDKSKICYCSLESRAVELFSPFEGMVLYFIKESSFLIYHNTDWQVMSLQGSIIPVSDKQKIDKFTGIEGKFCPDNTKDILYLYLNNDCELDFIDLQQSVTTFVIKQNYQNCYELKWPVNILWPGKQPHIMNQQINAMDIIRLYRIPESEHFLAEIINQNYQF